ncbi:MAG TPA: hypothetical protein VIO32_12040 [Candidatus Baltobacteraceae bacterium]
MQKLASAFLALFVLGSTAYAAAQTSPATAPSPAPSNPITSNTTATAGQPNFGELISSLNNARSEVAKVQAFNGSSANNIRPVNVAQLNGDSAALTQAMTRNQAQLNALRAALNRVTVTTMTNEHITVAQFLSDNRIGLNQVVGADVNNGTLVLFFQK